MADDYRHLIIEKEPLINPRRRIRRSIPGVKRSDISAHGSHLGNGLEMAVEQANQEITSSPDKFILKLSYSGSLDFAHLDRHGIEFISQEGEELCIAFADEQGLAVFSEHIERLGLNDSELSYRQILEALEGIGNWSSEDRTSWAIEQRGFPDTDKFNLDIELWPIKVASHPERHEFCEKFESWLKKEKILQLDKVNLDSLLMYRVSVSQKQAKLLLNHREIRLVDLTPETGISYQQLDRDVNEIADNVQPPAPDSAKICILDSGINTNHPLLAHAIAESQSFIENEDESDQTGHGTAVASIAVYGDLELSDKTNSWLPACWIYNGKIMKRCPDSGETIFDQQTIESTLIEAVKYFVDLGCRIFNLSLGNANAPYDGRHVRGIAYVLDKLSRENNILFVVSAGNFSGSIDPPIPQNSWRDEYPGYLIDPASVIIDPATALNVLTVGSLARHNATDNAQKYPEILQLSPANENQPSPFTRHGPSVKGALKPELVAMGGNLANPMREEGKQWKSYERGLGVLACHHNFVGSTLFKEVSGTSFAAPYITHLAARLLGDYPDSSANLLRALLVNHANLPPEVESTFSASLKQSYKKSIRTKNRDISRDIVGYGLIDEDALYRSSENVVVIMAEDSIKNNEHQFFELPLPSDYLRSNRATRELRVTLAYSPAVRTTRLDYVATRINFRLVKGTSLDEVEKHFNNDKDKKGETDAKNDSVSDKRRIISSSLRNKGTVQSSCWRFKQLSSGAKWFIVVTRHDRDWGENISLENESYALVVTVTDRENEEAKLYTQIKQRIRPPIRSRA